MHIYMICKIHIIILPHVLTQPYVRYSDIMLFIVTTLILIICNHHELALHHEFHALALYVYLQSPVESFISIGSHDLQ